MCNRIIFSIGIILFVISATCPNLEAHNIRKRAVVAVSQRRMKFGKFLYYKIYQLDIFALVDETFHLNDIIFTLFKNVRDLSPCYLAKMQAKSKSNQEACTVLQEKGMEIKNL